MKKYLLILLLIGNVVLAVGQDTVRVSLDSSRLSALTEKYKPVEKLIKEYAAKTANDTSMSQSYKNHFVTFIDTLIQTLLNNKVECKNTLELYLAKHDLTILDSQVFNLTNDDILKYRIYSGLSFLNRITERTNIIDSPKIFYYIDTLAKTYTFVTKNIKREYFVDFSKADRDFINTLTQKCFALLTEYEEAKKMNYPKKTEAEKITLKSNFQFTRPKIYAYFIFLDSKLSNSQSPRK